MSFRHICKIAPFLLALAWPDARAAEDRSGEVKPAGQCPLLFGVQRSHDRNRTARKKHLDSILEGEHAVNLTHTGGWRRPERIRFQGLELMATAATDEAEPRALVEVVDLPAGLRCPPGLYELRVDNSIGGETRVLAILDDSVLLEHRDQLRFLKVSRTSSPVWRMIWRSTWTVAGAMPAGGSSPGTVSGSSRSSSRPPPSRRSSRKTTPKSPSRRSR